MRDVAALADVSVQTVSNLVNERFSLMTAATRERVERAMEELAYHPNVTARSLRSSRTDALGFLVLDESARFLADPMTDLVIAGIGDVTRDRGYGLLIQAARPDGPKPDLLKPLLENRVDGAFLFLSGVPSLRSWYVNRTLELGFEFVLFEESADDRVATVTAANREGARRLTEHLIADGHTRIAFTASAAPWPMVEQRLLGYRDALRAAGIPPRPELEVFEGGWRPSTGAALADRLLDTNDPPTAIMGGNDLLAVGAIRAVRQRGMRVPDDVAVTGFDDFDFSELVDPPLTTVRIPGYDIGRSAAELLIDRLEGRQPLERRRLLPVELCLRGSG
jgi:DNA-binding LacI/PurR family transcriptional regulator